MRRVRPASWSLGLTLAGLLSCADGADEPDPKTSGQIHTPISDWPGRNPPGGDDEDPSSPGGTGGGPGPDLGEETPPTSGPSTPGGGQVTGPGGAPSGGSAGGVQDAGAPPQPAFDAGIVPSLDAAAPADDAASQEDASGGDAGVADAAADSG